MYKYKASFKSIDIKNLMNAVRVNCLIRNYTVCHFISYQINQMHVNSLYTSDFKMCILANSQQLDEI